LILSKNSSYIIGHYLLVVNASISHISMVVNT
jgi:hypothetical protein